MRLLPRRYRFAAAVLTARLLRRYIRHTPHYAAQRPLMLDTAADIALYVVLAQLAKRGVALDPRLRFDTDDLAAALRSGRGVLIVGTHNFLGRLLAGYLLRNGHNPMVISKWLTKPFFSTTTDRTLLKPSPTYLLTVRNELRNGGLVCAMLDRYDPTERRVRRFDTAEGPLYISDVPIRVARLAGATILFVAAHAAEEGEIAFDIQTATSEEVVEELVAFVAKHKAIAARS